MRLSRLRLLGLARMTTACTVGLVCAAAAAPGTGSSGDAGASRDPGIDFSSWAADPTAPGPDLPPVGRSLFDHLFTDSNGKGKAYRVPFPFSTLTDRIQARLAQREFMGGSRVVMLPMGRSLQRTAAAPDFFKYPRIVFAVTGEPISTEHDAGALLRDRLYIGYVEKTAVLEVISYNEAAGRFEFQLVKDYRAGAQPKVFYANRAICISCHQNHAPIFSRAIWSETNANNRVAELLRLKHTGFDLSAQANIDFPDDIDKATVRANSLVALQRIWQQGCSDAQNLSASRRCRTAAFTAILQYGLSGEQDFASGSPGYQSAFVSTLGRVWRQKWPQGVSIAESSLPDRNPFGGTTAFYGAGGSAEPSVDWIAAAHVTAELDPLNPRPAREIWRFAGAMDTKRFIAGWTQFFTPADFRALDAHLLQQGASGNVQRAAYQARCTPVRDAPGSTALELQCASDAAGAQGVHLAGRFDALGGGRIDWLNLGPAGGIRDAVFSGGTVRRTGSEYLLRATLKRKGLTARLSDGRALASVEIRWPAGGKDTNQSKAVEARIEVVVLEDFALLRRAVDRLLDQQPALFDDGPLVRANLMRALFSELGMSERSWCCADDTGMPPAMLDPPEVSANAFEDPDLQPFFRYCATCHLTRERFPPNFLSGDASQVAQNLRQCAPRILVRLAAWDTPAEQRVKSPMPPVTALQALGTTTQRWAGSEELRLLRAYLEGVSRREGRPSDVDELVKEGYEALPTCLPAPNY
jgi:hypothetical protein